jgi:diguanylate cyclase (GGDEF)-like protein
MMADDLSPLRVQDNLHALFGRRPRLLVVDDQPTNVQVLYQTFAADHQVLMATSGEQALNVCAAKQPDLVLLDVVMPGMDGYEVCARLKSDPALRDIPVVFVSAQDDEVSEANGLDVGAVDYISKPINPKIVRARVKTHLTLKRQSDLLREWVYLDGLTNVCNRRYFEERMVIEWARAARQRTPLSMLMIDVDYFKRYNDRYGHQAGDDCLRRVASELKESLKRPSDLVARYGGEEFVCLLPETGLQGAMQLAEQIATAVRDAGIEHQRSQVPSVVTCSIGVCSKPADLVSSGPALLRAADAQLYMAKASGRNRVCGMELGAD